MSRIERQIFMALSVNGQAQVTEEDVSLVIE
jgi:hypothetical protein